MAGILTEMASERERVRHVVVGVGINVNTAAFPPEPRAFLPAAAGAHDFERAWHEWLGTAWYWLRGRL